MTNPQKDPDDPNLPKADPASTYAVVVGISEYPGGGVSPVPGAMESACDFYDWLIKRGVPPGNVKLFLSPTSSQRPDAKLATHDEVYRFFSDDIHQLNGELLIVFWCGHGIKIPDSGRRLLYANSTMRGPMANLRSLRGALKSRAIRFPHQMLVIDACAKPLADRDRVTLPDGGFPIRSSTAVDKAENGQFIVLSVRDGQASDFNTQQGSGAGANQVGSPFFRTLMDVLAEDSTGAWPPPMPQVADTVRQRIFTTYREALNSDDPAKRAQAVLKIPQFEIEDWSGSTLIPQWATALRSKDASDSLVTSPEGRLALRTALWKESGSPDFLPGFWEYWRLRRSTQNEQEQKMMLAAWWRIFARSMLVGGLLVLTVCLVILIVVWQRGISAADQALHELEGLATPDGKMDLRRIPRIVEKCERAIPSILTGRLASAIKETSTPEPTDPSEPTDTFPQRKLAIYCLAAAIAGDTKHMLHFLSEPSHSTVRAFLVAYAFHALTPQKLTDQLHAALEGPQTESSSSCAAAILLCLSVAADHEPMVAKCRVGEETLPAMSLQLAKENPDSGLHSAAGHLYCKIGGAGAAKQLNEALLNPRPDQGRGIGSRPGWAVNNLGQTFIVFQPVKQFRMGSTSKGDKRNLCPEHDRKIERVFAIGSHEVTLGEYQRFLEDVKRKPLPVGEVTPPPNPHRREQVENSAQAIDEVTWHQAAIYCVWLSRECGQPESEWCYSLRTVSKPNGLGVMVSRVEATLVENSIGRKGYRLPTEGEWEYAARGGTNGLRHCGNDHGLLRQYAVFGTPDASPFLVGTRLPNQYGLFDVLGNVKEMALDQTSKLSLVPATPAWTDTPNIISPKSYHARGGGQSSRREDILSGRFDSLDDVPLPARHVGFRLAKTIPDGNW